MDNNIYYKIEEYDNNDVNYDNNDVKNLIYNDEYLFTEYDYTDISIKNINLICDYYKIKKGKLSKKEKIMEIIFFESNIDNINIVENRKLLWEYVKIIKTDKFLKNYILLDI